MIKYICLALAILITPANADQLTVGDLTDEQRVELKIQALQMEKEALSVPMVEQVNEWSQVGSNAAIAIAAAAKELGKSVDEFLNTTVGLLTTIVILWMLIGVDLVQIVFGLLWFFTAIPIWFYFYRKTCVIKDIIYYEKTDKSPARKEVRHWDEDEVCGTRWAMWITTVFIVGAWALISFV